VELRALVRCDQDAMRAATGRAKATATTGKAIGRRHGPDAMTGPAEREVNSGG
jgi:hypothetical protein